MEHLNIFYGKLCLVPEQDDSVSKLLIVSYLTSQAHVAGSLGSSDQLELWDRTTALPSSDQTQQGGPAKPVFELWAPSHSGKLQLSSSGLLAVSAMMGDVYVRTM